MMHTLQKYFTETIFVQLNAFYNYMRPFALHEY